MRIRIASLVLFLGFCAISVSAQDKYFTRNGHIYFISRMDFIDLDANNYQVGSILNIQTGEMVVTVLNKSFQFKYALAEEHFNENYMETHKYPKSSFKGFVKEIENVDLSKNGEYEVTVRGDLSMHGITKAVSAKGKITKDGQGITAKASFSILLKDYKMKIPSIVADKVNELIEIEVIFEYKPLPEK
ncbi:MAG: YceI family protein [Bacteroidetes bacterium]|nr:YceI family protein [Bacteroidota bacterium]MBU1720825.1 YceI family protein [Bacteroidota bacterium]